MLVALYLICRIIQLIRKAVIYCDIVDGRGWGGGDILHKTGNIFNVLTSRLTINMIDIVHSGYIS